MVNGNNLALASDPFQRHSFRAVTARGHHHAIMFLVDEVGAGATQARG